MASKVRLSEKAKINKSKKICGLYSEGLFTIASCCEAAGVKYETFKSWGQPHLTDDDIKTGSYRRGFVPEVHSLYKRALENNQINFKALLKDVTRAGILIRLSGTIITEKETLARYNEDGKPAGIIIRKTEKPVLPDTTMLIFVAKAQNIFGSYVERNNNDVYTTNNQFQHLTDEELLSKRLELESELKNGNYC